jgi:hypothetical protein
VTKLPLQDGNNADLLDDVPRRVRRLPFDASEIRHFVPYLIDDVDRQPPGALRDSLGRQEGIAQIRHFEPKEWLQTFIRFCHFRRRRQIARFRQVVEHA